MARSRKTPRGPAAVPAPVLAAHLEKGDLPGVVVLAGSEPWFRSMCLASVLDAALPQGDTGGALVRLDARDREDRERVPAAVDELRTASLFGSDKVVVIENPEAAPASGDRSGAAALKRIAVEAAEASVPGARLVLSTALPVKGRGAVPTKALLESGALVVDCRALYDAPAPWERGGAPFDHELSRFLATRMRRAHGKRLGLEDAHALSLVVGGELGALEDALRSLALYLADREAVTAADVERIAGRTREDPVWKLVDAVFDGDVDVALDRVTAAFERGLTDARGSVNVRPEAIGAMVTAALHATYRRVLAGAEALAGGEEADAVARAQGVPPFLASRFLERCRRDPRRLLSLNRAFFETEAGVKGGSVPARLAVERLVVVAVRALRAGVPTTP